MANYRQIHTQIWTDNWFLELAPDEKLLFIYLFSNDKSSLSGLYEIHDKLISFETGMRMSRINTILNKFAESGKVYAQDGLIWIVNMQKYHTYKNESVKTRIEADIKAIPDCELKNKFLIHSGYTLSTDCGQSVLKEKEKEKEKESEKEEEPEKKDEEEFAPEGGPSVSGQQLDDLCDYFKLKSGKIAPADVGVLAELLKVFRPGDIKRGIDHMLTRTDRPNTGLLKKVLKDWSQERKIHKVYG